tara:strand:- start:15741 stop:16067 length:327 start_codon:yes stop_codon:yes gene_type:complete
MKHEFESPLTADELSEALGLFALATGWTETETVDGQEVPNHLSQAQYAYMQIKTYVLDRIVRYQQKRYVAAARKDAAAVVMNKFDKPEPLEPLSGEATPSVEEIMSEQ